MDRYTYDAADDGMKDVYRHVYGEPEPPGASSPLIFRPESAPVFSTSSPDGFRLDGARWFSVDHYLLAVFCYADTPLADALRRAPTHAEVRRLVKLNPPPRPLGHPDDRAFLVKGLTAKFKAHSRLREELLATGNRPLGQHPSPGEPGQWTCNRLGAALMAVRTALRRSEAQTAVWNARKAAGARDGTDVQADADVQASPDTEALGA